MFHRFRLLHRSPLVRAFHRSPLPRRLHRSCLIVGAGMLDGARLLDGSRRLLGMLALLSLGVLVTGCTALAAGDAEATAPARVLGTPTPVHDPAIIGTDGAYYALSTGAGIPIWRSRDLKTWRRIGQVFEGPVPGWAGEYAPAAVDLWAPDISRVGDRYVLAYSVSRQFGANEAAIGIAVSDSLDPKAGSWRDLGPVMKSTQADPFNAIDPQVVSTRDGRVYLAFGSMWSGIFLRPLDPVSLRPYSEELIGPIASRPTGNTIEAPYLFERDRVWYLIVSFDACCRGVKSTYNLRIGRSDRIRGPYLDAAGTPMTEGGGTPLLSGDGVEAGTGHCSVIRDGDRWLLAYHYYDREAAGRPTLGIRELFWEDGWPRPGPQLVARPTASERVEMEAP